MILANDFNDLEKFPPLSDAVFFRPTGRTGTVRGGPILDTVRRERPSFGRRKQGYGGTALSALGRDRGAGRRRLKDE
jgi:hypothetical protein